jgi:UDP-N-acetyl-D-glucosamine dehydrogenase
MSSLEQAVSDKSAKVGVIGLGYVGLPLIRAFVAGGFRTMGFDVDQAKLQQLLAGKSYIKHISAEWIARCVGDGTFLPTADMTRLGEADALLICVPTPLNESRDPDLTFIEQTATQIAKTLRPGQLVVLESTTYPGTTEEIVAPLFTKKGFTVGEDIFIAFSPERVDPGNKTYNTRNTPRSLVE